MSSNSFKLWSSINKKQALQSLSSTLSRDEVSKMIKDAEENSSSDKAKKSIVNLTYELDNLLAKAELIETKYLTQNSDSELLFLESLKEIKELYTTYSIGEISEVALETFKYAINISLAEYFNKQFASKSGSSNTKRGDVIDVTDN